MTVAFQLRLLSVRLYRREVKTRFPFRFGKSSMTEMPIITLRAILETENGTLFEGVSASGIPPLWFDKRQGKTPADNEKDLLLSVEIAVEAYQRAGLNSALGLHRAVTEPVRKSLTEQGLAALAAGFGPALIEAAVVDGACRHTSLSFSKALRSGVLGLSPEDAALLPVEPEAFLHLRHTVGLADAIAKQDLDNPLRDGLPESLEEVVQIYRPTFFKVKMSGNAAVTLPRLKRIAEILDRQVGDYQVTLDGNEQFATMAAFADFWDSLSLEPDLQAFLKRTLWIEQPVYRDTALDPASAPALARISASKPVILDESDGEADALERGLALGYSGVSSKTCKGLFRSISHYLRLHRLDPDGKKGLTLSSEDLTTVPVLPLQQDLCLAAALGLKHTERNGHHYIRGFDFLSSTEGADALALYPSLYASDALGKGRVRVTKGGFDLSEVNAAKGFGSVSVPEWSAMQSIDISTYSNPGGS